MKLFYVTSLFLVSSCIAPTDDFEDEGIVESESAPLAPQGSVGQGSSMQGSSMQGSSMQGTYGGSGVSYASVNGTAIIFWKKSGGTWRQYFPDKICYWNSKRTVLDYCQNYGTGTSSPLVGSTWPTTFTKKNADGTTTTIPVTLRIEAVRSDSTIAMHPLRSSNYATATLVPYGSQGCENPDGCRPNSDMWNYDVKAIDVVDANGNPQWLCPSGQTAIALAGTWPSGNKYQFAPSSTQFTFACTNGTIAKCTRWGYRNYDAAIRDNDQFQIKMSMDTYHQACIYAASADYCGIGKSMTYDGTLVDIYDYMTTGQLPDNLAPIGVPDHLYNDGVGYIPRLDSHVYPNPATVSAFALEGHFDRYGGLFIDHTRYDELSANPNFSIAANCPTTYAEQGSGEFFEWTRIGPNHDGGMVRVNSAPACSHSERTVGKYLHSYCSTCTGSAPATCNDPLGPGWTIDCVNWASTSTSCDSSSEYMSIHSECTVGSGLFRYDSGCTLSVCSQYPSCCSFGASAWSSACVGAANAICKGGREGFFRGFCGTSIIAPPPAGSTL